MILYMTFDLRYFDTCDYIYLICLIYFQCINLKGILENNECRCRAIVNTFSIGINLLWFVNT